jgi:hypothetical protein
MRINLQLLLVIVLSSLFYNTTLSQTENKQKPLSIVVYNENVNDPLTEVEMTQIQAVYGDKTIEYVLSHAQRVKDIKNILRNRVEIFDAGDKDLSGLPKLSQVELLNDYVPSLKKDYYFNAENFNPLKYKFNFYSRYSEIYWVDNTTYYIEIKSQHEQNDTAR